MTITQDRRRFNAVKQIVMQEEDSAFRECLAETLTLTFTDDQLRDLILSESEVATDSEHAVVDLEIAVRQAIDEVRNDRKFGSSEVYLKRLRILAAAMNRVKDKYGDPSRSGYRTAMECGASTIVEMQRSLNRWAGYPGTDIYASGITAQQAETLIAVLFLQHQSGSPDIFEPVFANVVDQSLTNRWMTQIIMKNPVDPEVHADSYQNRVARLRGLEQRFGQELNCHDNMCDYPEEMLQRLLALKQSSSAGVWRDVERFIIMRQNAGPHLLSETLFFMTPHVPEMSINYLSTMVSSLHEYPALPVMDDYSKAAPHIRAQCAALLLVATTIDNELKMVNEHSLRMDGTIASAQLINLLLDEPEMAERIAAAIVDRQTGDFDTISGIAAAGAVGNGYL